MSMRNFTDRSFLTYCIDNLELRSKVDTITLNMGVILAIINSNKKGNVCVETSFWQSKICSLDQIDTKCSHCVGALFVVN